MQPQELSSRLTTVYGNKLESVVLYGSAADGEFHKGHSDYNILIVLTEISVVELAKSKDLLKKWAKDGNPAPLFFTHEEIKSSADVFPIEFSDIKKLHKILAGTDPFAQISIDLKNLRHQCEHELRSKLLTLRSRIPFIEDKPKEIIKLVLESSSSFFAIFRGVLNLLGKESSTSKKAAVELLSAVANFNPTIFLEILDVRAENLIWKSDEAFEKLEQYLTSIDSVVKFVNNI